MKKLFLIAIPLFLIIVVMAGGVAVWFYYNSGNTQWQTYTDQEYKFAINYPRNWIYSISVLGAENLVFCPAENFNTSHLLSDCKLENTAPYINEYAQPYILLFFRHKKDLSGDMACGPLIGENEKDKAYLCGKGVDQATINQMAASFKYLAD